MPFRLRNDTKEWFSQIDGVDPFKADFDIYYFCLVVGLAVGRSVDPLSSGVPSKVFVNEFIQDYKPSQRLLTGLLVTAELKRGGIDLTEKAAVRDLFKRLVASNNPTGLTEDGMKRLNAYCSGGFEYLAETRGSRPTSPQAFLREYINVLEDILGET